MLTELGSLGLNLNITNTLNPPKDSEEMVYRIHFTFLKKTGMDIKFPFKHIFLFIYNKPFDIYA